MYRNTQMYDTLMQMGRWFGYRPGYEDLCRVYLSEDSINWYGHIADASEELRQQIKRMRRDGLSPRQFGLYVRAHPDSLLITAANKMRSGERVKVRQNFSGRLLESFVVSSSSAISEKNEELIAEYWKSGFGGHELSDTGKGWIARGVNIEVIEEFLTKFKSHPFVAESKSNALTYLRAIGDLYKTGDVLLISVAANGEDAGNFRLGTQNRQSAAKFGDDGWRMSKDRVASRGDEKLGLSASQLEQAKIAAATDDKSKSKEPSDVHYREVRKKPLLMIHVLGPVGSPPAGDRVPAFGISFPPGHYDTEIEVVANRVWIQHMQGSVADDPDTEEDYDE